MNQLLTRGIVLSRTDFGEADRILTLLTPDYGKLRLIAKGVRRIRSKLAGGVELFSISDLTFVRGRGEIGTLISARLKHHFGQIVQDLSRVQLGYELIRLLHKNTEDELGAEYFYLLEHALRSIDDAQANADLVWLWFAAQLLRFSGHMPNLVSERSGQRLAADGEYEFSFEDMAFVRDAGGRYGAQHIKLLRLLFGEYSMAVPQKLQAPEDIINADAPLIRTMFSASLSV